MKTKINYLNLCKQCDTTEGAGLLFAVTKRYIDYNKKYKRRPKVLMLGKNQKIIIENDKSLAKILSDGEIKYTNEKTEIKFK